MHVSDVKAAFPLLPLVPWLWPFFFIRFFARKRRAKKKGERDAPEDHMNLFVHTFAEFGTRGLPGAFKRFFVDVLVGMAYTRGVIFLVIYRYRYPRFKLPGNSPGIDGLCSHLPDALRTHVVG